MLPRHLSDDAGSRLNPMQDGDRLPYISSIVILILKSILVSPAQVGSLIIEIVTRLIPYL
jgi:hypothetical protein